ncbi:MULTISPECIES: galactose oxidase-like domain-containing protein [unclassified Aureimonas]|uniref:galactose oxidase-like domain-containing protein n=1 Tax=unclassified Aureimonas TaxID=2615206 RepID=UPI001FCD76FE|nr:MULTISPECIES: galactose oxidase-like domain-containing protein [unclassified Aureimonas]
MLLLHVLPASAQIAVGAKPDLLLVDLALPANAPEKGLWSSVKGWPLVALHSALMPSGAVMTYGTPLAQGVQDGRTFDLWDPNKGLDDPASHYTFPNAQAIDSFCSAATLLTSGSMLISGGSSGASGLSAQASTLLDPGKATPTALTSALASRRWYASMISLPDGRALIAGGAAPYATEAYNDVAGSLQRGDVSMTPEIYKPSGGWTRLVGATSRDAFGPDLNRWWYPRMWVAPSGNVFGLSADKMWTLNPTGNGTIATLGTFKGSYSATAKPNIGPTSTAVMFDVGRILQVGGNGAANGQQTPSSAAATVFDIRGGSAILTEQPAMAHPRQWATATVLADGSVVVTGGTRFGDNAGPNAVYPAEIWTPSTGRWRTGASAATYRGYHSSALLLPNGSVLVTGGGVPGPVDNLNAEVYYPPYLFKTVNGAPALAERPVVARVSATGLGYGAKFVATLAGNQTIARAAVVGLGSTTHSFNSGQRYIPATVSQSGADVSVTMPANANLAPPGYYMVFLLDASGVPSKGVIVSLGGAAAVIPAPEGAGPLAAQIGIESKRVARGGDGTTVVLNSKTGALWKLTGDNAAAAIPAPVGMKDVAVVTAKSFYAIGTDNAVYRYNGTGWKVVGARAKTVGASEDGTVVVTSLDDTIWLKNADSDVEAWTNVPGKALRVSPMSANVLWSIGMDGNVYRGGRSGSWVQAGVDVSDIATAADGRILVTNKPTNVLWTKGGDDAVPNWTNLPLTAQSIAIARGGRIVAVDPNGVVVRK